MRFILIILIACPLAGLAQSSPAPTGWKTNITAGEAFGESMPGLVLQAGGGFRFRNFYAGAGAGYDKYKFESYPVFADFRFFPVKVPNLFIYGQGGYSLPNGSKKGTDDSYLDIYDISGGLYSDIGVGYNLMLKKKQALALSLGYSLKKVSVERYGYTCLYCSGPSAFERTTSIYNYNLRRIMLKMLYEITW
ncbi:MAG: hypothetical protein ABWZ25_01200 [Chitinophagaceae bacterium]